MNNLLRHLLRYGGAYLILGMVYLEFLWVVPIMLARNEGTEPWVAVLIAHVGAAILVWGVSQLPDEY